MNLQSEEVEVAPAVVPASPPKLTLVVILAALLGVLLTVIAAGAWLHYQQRAAWDAEVLTLKDALKKKAVALDEMQAQNATLGKQLKILKAYSIASSTAASDKSSKAESVAAPAEGEPKPKAAPKTPVSTKAKQAKAQPQDCELIGKTPEQQAATLQRCVSQIESPPAKPQR